MMRLYQISKSILITFLSCILVQLTLANSQVNYVEHFCAELQNIYPQNSTYNANLNLFLSNLSSEASVSSSYNYTARIGTKTINGLFYCRGDLSLQVCRDCVDAATENISQGCYGRMEGLIWYQQCMLWYSSRDIITIADTSIYSYLSGHYNLSNNDQFNEKLSNTMNDLINKAASGSSIPPKYATGETNISVFQKLYCLVQCNPSITGNECTKCLQFALSIDPPPTNVTRKAMIFIAGCQLMYDIVPFYSERSSMDAPPPSVANPPPASSTDGNGPHSRTKTIVLVVFAVCISMIFIIILIRIYMKKRKRKEKIENIDASIKLDSLQYDFCTVELATDHFSDANKLGQGGFGAVYKGQLPNGQEIAVKRLSRNSGQGEEEFKNEILLLAKLQHRNLVKLLGFCLEGLERLLIYEFMPNASLNHFIVDSANRESLDWERRYKIIRGIARGLLYLHEDLPLCIVHRDLKASNILLDSQMNPKISDFGMARLFKVDQTKGSTSRIVGTYGYIAPEYVQHGKFSIKSDVYSFGVLVLEIVCGQRNSDFHVGDDTEILLSYVWKRWVENTAIDFVDPTLTDAPENEIVRCIHIGLLCVQENAVDRPTMASVVQILNDNPATLPVPSRPAFFINTGEVAITSPHAYSSSGMESTRLFHSLLN